MSCLPMRQSPSVIAAAHSSTPANHTVNNTGPPARDHQHWAGLVTTAPPGHGGWRRTGTNRWRENCAPKLTSRAHVNPSINNNSVNR